MEHSALHAFELVGQLIALGGVILIWGILRPAKRALELQHQSTESSRKLQAGAERWIFYGLLMCASATFLNQFVEVAEAQGKTVFGGINLPLLAQFVTETRVGRLELARIVVLLLTAGVVRSLTHKQTTMFAYSINLLKWCLIAAGIFASIFLTSMVSHSAALPKGRFLEITARMTHIITAALWLGVLIQLLAARRWIEGKDGSGNIGLVAEIVRRFSPVALTVTTLLMLSGVFMAAQLAGSSGALLTSAYGLILLVKLTMLVPALFAGSVNFRVIRPQLIACAAADFDTPASAEKKAGVLKHFGRMLELEVTAGVLVIMTAGILASVSPPGESGIYRLTPIQTQALLSPRFPDTTLPDPATFYGLPMRTLGDFQYSEFSHHWSGVMVILLGLGWLLQAVGGRLSKWAGLGWPFLLIPFMVYVMVVSDPEIWILRRVGFWQVVGDPQLLEHKLGALMLLVLAWFGWRDRRTPQARRPLGYVLPMISIMGGALLLGHVHSTLNIDEQVGNLINYQHVIFGAFMIFAGAVRWLTLRGLFPQRIGNLLWPSSICALGVFMAFFYRELM